MDRLIILAAGRGNRLRPLTDRLSKCMVPLHGRPLIEWQVKAAREAGIRDITIVRGFLGSTISLQEVRYVANDRYETTNMVASLLCAKDLFEDRFLVGYGDIIYDPSVLEALMKAPFDLSVIADLEWKSYWENRFTDVLADAESFDWNEKGELTSIGQKPKTVGEIRAQYIGLSRFQGTGISRLRNFAEKRAANLDTLFMTDLFQGLIDEASPVHYVPVRGKWLEVDSLSDLEIAHRWTRVTNGKLEFLR